MSSFLAFAGDKIAGLTTSLANKLLGDKVKEFLLQRKMKRLIEDAVDRIVAQADEYLQAERADLTKKEILIVSLCDKLQPLADEPQKFFSGDLNGQKLFDQCHPKGELPEAIRHEGLQQFYTVLFPQIAHFLAGSKFALIEWQVEGYREGFRRLSQIADEISGMNAKVAALPGAVADVLRNTENRKADTLLRGLAQTFLNRLLLKLDISPLRAERSLYGSLSEHFVIPQFCERKETTKPVGDEESILQALCVQGTRRILHGGAGVGKTTCALWLQSRLLQASDQRLAVLVRLRQEVDIERYSLLDIVKKQAGVHLADSITTDLLNSWHEAGKLVLILDGFDEVPESRRDGVEKWIVDLGAMAKQTSIIVTSRPLQSGHLEKLVTPWAQWDLLAFDGSRIVDFIERWHRHLPEGELSIPERQVDGRALASTFMKDPSLKPLTDTPLMLGTLLFVHHRDKKLPSGRVDLYERYIAAMLGLRDSGLGIEARATKLTDKEKRRVLSHVALHFHSSELNEVNDDAMRELVGDALKSFRFNETTDRLLPAMCERTGLIQGPGAWSFVHKTIGEFLVAELICEGTTFLPNGTRLDRQELWTHRHEDQWTNVLFFWAGKTTPRELEEFIDDLVNEDDEKGPLLAISLLGDQGDRLTYDTQQHLASRFLAREVSYNSPGITAYASTTTVPSRHFFMIEVDHVKLRGLSETYVLHIFSKLFSNAVVPPNSIHTATSCHRDLLTIGLLWSLERSDALLNKTIDEALLHCDEQQRALLVFNHAIDWRLMKHSTASMVEEWLAVYPWAAKWLPLLLIGLQLDLQVYSTIFGKQVSRNDVIGPLLWDHHVLPLDDVWLKDSYDWTSRYNESAGDRLQKFNDAFSIGPASAWGISDDQHLQLATWLEQVLEKREELYGAQSSQRS